MFNRRLFVALAVCFAVSASSAFAGGNGGTKKDSTVRVRNESSSSLYAFVNVSSSAISDAAAEDDPAAAFEELGGKLVEPGGEASFQVKTGNQKLTVIDVDNELPVFVDRPVKTSRGKTTTVVVHESDLGSPT